MTIPGPGWPTREWMIQAKVKIIFTLTKMILTFAGRPLIRLAVNHPIAKHVYSMGAMGGYWGR